MDIVNRNCTVSVQPPEQCDQVYISGGKIIVHLREEGNQLVLKVKRIADRGYPLEHQPFILTGSIKVDASATRKERAPASV